MMEINEPWKTLLTALAGGGGLMALAKLLERIIPSRDTEAASEQKFRADLLSRIGLLEADRDKLTQEVAARDRTYWELFAKYNKLEQEHQSLHDEHEVLRARVERLQAIVDHYRTREEDLR